MKLPKKKAAYFSSSKPISRVLRKTFSLSRTAPGLYLFNLTLVKYLVSRYLGKYNTVPETSSAGSVIGY